MNTEIVAKDKDHPRLCGDHDLLLGSFQPVKGSPPPVRGPPTFMIAALASLRITPACAGTT